MQTITSHGMQYDPKARLAQIMQGWTEHPGRAPHGTGDTGLLSNDAQGYSDMLNEQTEALNLQNSIGGKGPVNVVQGAPLDDEVGQKKRLKAAYESLAPSWGATPGGSGL